MKEFNIYLTKDELLDYYSATVEEKHIHERTINSLENLTELLDVEAKALAYHKEMLKGKNALMDKLILTIKNFKE